MYITIMKQICTIVLVFLANILGFQKHLIIRKKELKNRRKPRCIILL